MNVPKWAVSLTVVLIASYGLLCTAQKGPVPIKELKFSNTPPGSIFIFGLGYTGERFAKMLLSNGWRVWGTTRSNDARLRFSTLGVSCVLFGEGMNVDELRDALSNVTHVLVTAPPTDEGDPMLARLGNILTSSGRIQWVGYLSTVGVYGDCDGCRVDETTPVKPLTQRAKRRVLAENQWLATGLPVHIFRLPGIYGPFRGPLEKVRDGSARRVLKEGHVFSRIHVDDICNALLASIAHPRPGAVYNVVDDEPAPGHVVTEFACRLLGTKVPPLVDFATADLTPMGRSFYAESRLMTNDLIKQELGVHLRHPTYREGLKAQLAEEKRSGLRAPKGATIRRFWSFLTGKWGPQAYTVASPVSPGGPTTVLIVDNGSLRAAATLSLRGVAGALEGLLRGQTAKPVRAVYATSVRFSTKIDPGLLDGKPAVATIPFLRLLLEQGERRFVLLPFFFGPSAAMYAEVVPQARALQREFPGATVEIAPPLVCRCPVVFPDPRFHGDGIIAGIIADRVMAVITDNQLQKPAVVLVDHGSPQPSVGRVRGYVASHLAPLLTPHVTHLTAACMERRDGPEYDFNDPMLKDVLDLDAFQDVDVVVALMFLGPGRHAGADGDIACIIRSSRLGSSGRVFTTAVVGGHPDLLPLLAQRYRQAVPIDAFPAHDPS
jgi:nucleoside-diphosphate-sugar epimerase